jgi:hypothetical protein
MLRKQLSDLIDDNDAPPQISLPQEKEIEEFDIVSLERSNAWSCGLISVMPTSPQYLSLTYFLLTKNFFALGSHAVRRGRNVQSPIGNSAPRRSTDGAMECPIQVGP